MQAVAAHDGDDLVVLGEVTLERVVDGVVMDSLGEGFEDGRGRGLPPFRLMVIDRCIEIVFAKLVRGVKRAAIWVVRKVLKWGEDGCSGRGHVQLGIGGHQTS